MMGVERIIKPESNTKAFPASPQGLAHFSAFVVEGGWSVFGKPSHVLQRSLQLM